MRFFVGTGTQDVLSKETGPKARQTLTIPKTHNPCTRGGYMPFEHQYGDSTPEINPQDSSDWRSVGDIAADIVAAKFRQCEGQTALEIAAARAMEIIFAIDNGDLTGADMAQKSLAKFFAEYAEASQ